MLSDSKLVADRFEAGSKLLADLQWAEIWPIYTSSELAWASRSATRFEPVCDQLQTRYRNGIWLWTGLRPASSYLDMSR